MKTFMKSTVVMLVAFCIALSPALMGMAKAGGINFEGIGPVQADSTLGYDEQPRGLMFNFSFGGPESTQQSSSIQEIYRADLTKNQKVGLGIGIVLAGVLVMFVANDDDNNNRDEE